MNTVLYYVFPVDRCPREIWHCVADRCAVISAIEDFKVMVSAIHEGPWSKLIKVVSVTL